MKKLITVLAVALATLPSINGQTPVGNPINGAAANDEFGLSVSLSSNGNRMAIGSIKHDGKTGHVRIYQDNGGNWDPIGEIDGAALSDECGFSVSLSSNGDRVAIGSIKHDGKTGHVRIYQYSGGNWGQIGNDIDGENTNDRSGYSVSLSQDGSLVAIGARANGGNGANSGHVRIYQYSGGNWGQIGNDIDGENTNDRSGFSVSLSQDGSRVAIGARGNAGNGTDAGHVRIYQYINGNWDLIGEIDGVNPEDKSGTSVSLSSDGSRVAIGAPFHDGKGHVRVFKYMGINNWPSLGEINGVDMDDEFGSSVSLSADGTVVAVGAPSKGNNKGQVSIYQLIGGTWQPVGNNIDGAANNDEFGTSVSLSSDGTKVAIGAPFNGNNNNGQVKVYENVILPVELISFEAREQNANVFLKWNTASELNNSGFEIQKSKDRTNWSAIDFVTGRGTTNEVNEYQYQDKNPYSGINYYRLKQIDLDGVFDYSKVVAVEYINLEKNIQVFPNPSNGLINLQIDNPSNQRMNIKISDNLGRIVWENKLVEGEPNWKKEIEIEGNGIYLISAQIGEKIHYKRVVITDRK